MRVLIVSDSHRYNENLFRVLAQTGPYDMLIHCGDVEGSEHIISEKAGCPVEMVQGNNDFFLRCPGRRSLWSGNIKSG